jgi:hypothetical protein
MGVLLMSTWHNVQGKSKTQARRPGWKSKSDFVTRVEHDAKNDALIQLVRTEWAMLRSDIATFRGDMVERFGKVEGEITGVKGQIEGLKGSLNTTQWVGGIAIALLALLTQVPSLISAYRFPPAGSMAVPAASPAPTPPASAASAAYSPMPPMPPARRVALAAVLQPWMVRR